MITLSHLKKEYPNATPLRDVNVTIHDGDVISVIGPSGTGKSTLIRCINLLETPTAGEILVNGKNITEKGCKIHQIRQKMGMVFQSFNLFGHLTVIENIMRAPMDLLGKSKQEAYVQGMELLRKVGLADKALSYPDMLSGGQKQRVAIARTLAMDPEIILFDEPTSALDPTMVGEVQAVIRDLAKSGKTMMIVTHEMKFAREICNRVFYMDQGGVYEEGTPEQIFDHPQKELTRRFIQHLKVLEINVTSRDFDFLGTMADITQYCYKNQIPSKTAYRIQSVFEEMCVQILMPVLPAQFRIKTVIEYAEASGDTVVTMSYDGPAFDPTKSDNALPLSFVSGAVTSLDYEAIEDAEYTNRLCMKIR